MGRTVHCRATEDFSEYRCVVNVNIADETLDESSIC